MKDGRLTLWRPGIYRTVAKLLFIIGILPLTILTGIFFFFYADGKKQAEMDVQKEIAEKISFGVAGHLRKAVGQVALFSAMLARHMENRNDMASLVQLFLELGFEYDSVAIADAAGREIAKASRYYTYRPDELGSMESTEAFQTAMKGFPHFSRIDISSTSHFPRIPLTLPIQNEQDRAAGVLQVGISVFRIWELISKEQIGGQRNAYIVDDQGVLIAHPDLSRVLDRQNFSRVPGVGDLLKNRTGVHEYEGISGERVIGAVARIPITGWRVVVEKPTAEAFSDFYTLSGIFIAIAALTLFSAVLLGLRFSTRRIISPIRRLKQGAEAVATGNFDGAIEPGTPDELGELARAFNRMRTDLNRTSVSRDRLIREIEDRKRIEAELREERDRAQTYLDISGVIILALNTKAKISLINRKGAEILGYPEEFLMGQNWFDIAIPAPHQSSVRDVFANLMEGGEEIHGYHENRVISRDGTTRIIFWHNTLLRDDAGRIIGTLSSGEDVTLRRQAEADRLRLAAVIEQAAEMVIVTDPDTVIQYVNPAFERILGWGLPEVVGRKLHDVQRIETDGDFYKNLMETLQAGVVWSGHFTQLRKDGTRCDIEATLSPIRDPSGAFIHYVSVQRDVTREKEMERQLRQTHKMEAIGTLAGGIAHDFNNILTAVMGFTELAIEDSPVDTPLRANLEEVLKAACRARDLVSQILTFSRQGETSLKALLIAPIIKEGMKMIRATLPSTIEIRQNIQSEARVRGDPTQIYQILMNLCVNAGHAMRKTGGILTVHLIDIAADAQLTARFSGMHPGRYVRLTVRDTGPGIPYDLMDRIFEPFFTTKEIGDGTGMGLAVVHGIVAACDGIVDVESPPGEGAAFHVYLPATPGPSGPEPSRTESLYYKGSGRILLVDDEPAIAEMGKQMIERLGYDVRAFTAVSDAIAVFEKTPDDFDLVLTDMTMPGMTGMALAERLLARRPDLPIILCTGHSDQVDEASVLAAGVRKFMMKPYSMNEMGRMIREALDNR